ncbi:MAG: nitric oxide reductase NorD protein [Oleiphilaceae bacterium]|jgi:nitric oxide reductase NorD protein
MSSISSRLTIWLEQKRITTWLEQKLNKTTVSLESKQTGSCGGMSTNELKIRIELILDGVDTRKIIAPVTQLAALSHSLQSEFLIQLTEVADLSVTHGYSLLWVYAPALNLMKSIETKSWIAQIKQALEKRELATADSLIKHYTDFISQLDTSRAEFSDVSEILEKLVSTISGSTLTLNSINTAERQQAYTDGKQLFLPMTISLFDNYHDNYLVFKVIVFQLLGQIECDTRLAIERIQRDVLIKGDNFLEHFSILETLRINHYLKQSFPGIWNNILYLHDKLDLGPYPEDIFRGHVQPTVFDSLEMVDHTGIDNTFFEPFPYQCNFSPEKLLHLQSDEQAQPSILMNIVNNNDIEEDDVSNDTDNKDADRISLKHSSTANSLSNLEQQYPDIWEQLDEVIVKHQNVHEKLQNDKDKKNVYFYPEWDTSLQQYRQEWCRVEEIPIVSNTNETVGLDNVDLRFAQYRIKKTLDMIINSQRLIRHQSDGDDIDIDAWVDAKSNKTKHADDFQNLYIKNNKNSRSIAIMFAVDISGSTAGWKNKIIQQSIGLLSRTLSKLNDQYAIYAFSGSGREQCDIYPVKQFDEKYSNTTQQNIANLTAKQYTRMGAAIRHLSKILNSNEAKTKILFVLTDGRPDDIDSYRGHYGVEDTRRAFNEAKALSLNPFVLTFDRECIEYLPHMLGKNNYKLISDISMLPIQISTIYKQLTL